MQIVSNFKAKTIEKSANKNIKKLFKIRTDCFALKGISHNTLLKSITMIFNKKFKLQSYFDTRIPLCIRRRNNVVYFQTQIDAARSDVLRRGRYSEEKYKTDEHNIKEVGIIADKILKGFDDTDDLSIAEFKELVGMDIDQV